MKKKKVKYSCITTNGKETEDKWKFDFQPWEINGTYKGSVMYANDTLYFAAIVLLKIE